MPEKDNTERSEPDNVEGLTTTPCSLDLEFDANVALVRFPYGYAEFGGARIGRERRARLFMAAPDLYKALKDCMRLLNHSGPMADAAFEAKKAAHAAIKKANKELSEQG